MRMLYKYPHAAFPYDDLVNTKMAVAARTCRSMKCWIRACSEDNNYFDVHVEYAKNTPEDIVMRVTVENRADHAASLDLLPQIWARQYVGRGKAVEETFADLAVRCEGQPA